MKTTFSYFPGMFENPAPAKIIKKKLKICGGSLIFQTMKSRSLKNKFYTIRFQRLENLSLWQKLCSFLEKSFPLSNKIFPRKLD